MDKKNEVKKIIVATLSALATTTIIYFLGVLIGWRLDFINGWASATVYLAVSSCFNENT